MTDVHEGNVRHILSLYVVFPVKWTKKVNTRLSINHQEDSNQLKENKTNKNHPVWLETPLWNNFTGLLTVFMKINKNIF